MCKTSNHKLHKSLKWAGVLTLGALLIMTEQHSAGAQAPSDNGVTLLARTGNWVALRQADQGKTGQCAAFYMTQDGETAPLMLHADQSGLELRSGSKNWKFREGQQSTLTLTAGAYQQTIPMLYGDSHSLGNTLTAPQTQALITALQASPTTTLQLAGQTSQTLKDSGAAAVLNAFASCVTQAGFAPLALPSAHP